MGFWDFLKKKAKKPDYEFTEEDRALAAEKRRQQGESARLQRQIEQTELQLVLEERKAHLEELRSQLYDEEEDTDPKDFSVESMIMPLVAQFLTSKMVQNNPNVVTPTTQPMNSNVLIHLSDEELLKLKSTIPKQYVSIAKTMNDDTLLKIMNKYIGECDEDTKERALALIKN